MVYSREQWCSKITIICEKAGIRWALLPRYKILTGTTRKKMNANLIIPNIALTPPFKKRKKLLFSARTNRTFFRVLKNLTILFSKRGEVFFFFFFWNSKVTWKVEFNYFLIWSFPAGVKWLKITRDKTNRYISRFKIWAQILINFLLFYI